MKDMQSQDTILAYPDFSKPFHIYTEANAYQLGAVIVQNGKPLAFYSCKLTPVQRNYTTMEREILSIYETLRKYCNILLGQELHIYTDHKNLLYKNKDSSRINRWRILQKRVRPKNPRHQGNGVSEFVSHMPLDLPSLDDMGPSAPTVHAVTRQS